MSEQQAKHYVLYSRQNWKTNRFYFFIGMLGYFGLGLYDYINHHPDRALIPWGFALLFAILLPLFYLYTISCYVVFEAEGIRVHFPIRRALVSYTDVEKVGTKRIEQLFEAPERKRMRTGVVRRLYKDQAVCVRLREDDGLPERLRRKLGPRTVLGNELALAISEPDDAIYSIRQHLHQRRQEQVAARTEGRPARRHRRAKR